MPKLSYAQVDKLVDSHYIGFENRIYTGKLKSFVETLIHKRLDIFHDTSNGKEVHYIMYPTVRHMHDIPQMEKFLKEIEKFLREHDSVLLFAAEFLNVDLLDKIRDVSPIHSWHYVHTIMQFDSVKMLRRDITL